MATGDRDFTESATLYGISVETGILRPILINEEGAFLVKYTPLVSYDRQGDVFWYDDFEDGLKKWVVLVHGTGASVKETGAYSKSGGFSVELNTGAEAGNYAGLEKALAFRILGRLGYQVSYTSSANILYNVIYIIFFDGTYRITFGLRFEGLTYKLQYLNEYGQWVNFADARSETPVPGLFCTAKGVVDPIKLRYVRFLVDTETYNLSFASPLVELVSAIPHMLIRGLVYNKTGVNVQLWLDDGVVTQNEP